MRQKLLSSALAACALGVGCSPTFDWREVRPEGSGLVLLLPCKPSVQARRLPLAGAPVELTLLACSAGDVTWALAYADVTDPSRVGPALRALRESAAANLGAAASDPLPLKVKGSTPHAEDARLALSGKLPDGRPVREQLAVFRKGTRVFQATCVGAQLPADAVQTFFDGLQTPG
jgi:hypothetical protein